MPRNGLTEEQQLFVRENRTLGGVVLAAMFNVNVGQIYQFATTSGFSVKKGGRGHAMDQRINKMRTGVSNWPKHYRRYKSYLVKRDGLNCHYCQKEITAQEAQVDHIVARARGGTDVPSNLVLACPRCNHLKSSLCYDCPDFRYNLAIS